MAEVTIERLCKRYEGSDDLSVKDVSFTVGDGEFMVLLGPSGCGKSSALRMIAGLEPISGGTVAIDGRVINGVPAKDRDIAMVFQSYALYPHMTVERNLAFGLRRRRMPPEEIERRVASVAERLGLVPYLKRKPQALSGGQRQRVALGRAIVRDPKVFLFDEPLSNLDAALRVTTRNELIKQQHELGTTTIYVTHDQVEAMTMGDRICIMNSGEVVQIGKPLDVYRRPANTFVARFLGSPPMNLIEADLALDEGRVVTRLGGAVVEIVGHQAAALRSHIGGKIIVGIRPEDIYERPPGEARIPLAAVNAKIATVEPLGAETLVMLSLSDSPTEIMARSGRETRLRYGDEATLHIDTGALHLFDPITSRALARSDAAPTLGERSRHAG